ncbi:type I polyketide synthase [Catenuloplanes japonicus]|uniref:type I polyketide synthase n=1 Tax=Catenuloplanes japonicus TaxID=33876 RepID=UPI000525344B|nr:type I polyketide synthase [Catenuloplanes japonicus]
MSAAQNREDTSASGRELPPIAIIGMACRLPSAPDVESFWRLLHDGVDAITEVPASRYDADAVYDPAPRTPGRTVSRWGGFIDDIDAFDAELFGVSPREAVRMDPQQRILLETAWHALEDAGQAADRLAGSDTGVFVGQLGADYWTLQLQEHDFGLYGLTGAASRAVMSGRLSYAFDLRGPSFTMDTACSSSLVAVHTAVQSLRAGECSLAIAGAVNLVLLPEEGVAYSGAGMLAKDGRCKFGDASGDGFVRSDGVGAVILKPLDRALADGDRIRAVIRGSAIGNDGQSSGYLVTPGVDGQRAVVEAAYRRSGIAPSDVDYVEAHGTGTSVGDPVELEALSSVLCADRPADRPLLVGSAKTNIGHTEAAAGMAGLIKAVLCLEHGHVPPNLHFNDPNPAVDWAALPLRIPTEGIALPDRGRPAIAAVSSFGFSGTNGHLVLTAAEPIEPDETEQSDGRAELLVLSARSPEALTALAGAYATHLTGETGRAQPLHAVAHTAATRRAHLEARLAVTGSTHDQLAEALRDHVSGDISPALTSTDYAPQQRPRVAFVFPGQGSQWLGMGRELLDGEPAFAEALRACDRVIQDENGWSVIDLLRGDDDAPFEKVDVVQPVLWAMEIALAALWRSWGVEPDVVIGHSMGESAAAYVAGALSLQDAGAVICRRSRLAARMAGRGAMAWVELSAEEAAEAVAGHEDRVAVAAANSPTSTLLSGDTDVLQQILQTLDARDVANRLVRVNFASHCPQMDALRDDLLAELAHLMPRAGDIPIHSTLFNRVIDGSQLDAPYWARNIREPVDFVGAVRAQLDTGDTVFVEISPHPLLVSGIGETARHRGGDTTAAGSLRRGEPERAMMLTALGRLHQAGVPVDWDAVTGGGQVVDLPRYAFQRSSFWLPERPVTAPPHPLLGRAEQRPDGSRVWQHELDLTVNAYLLDHRVQDTVIMPGTAYVEMITAALRDLHGDRPVSVTGIHYAQAMFIDPARPLTIAVTAVPEGDGWRFTVHTRRDGEDWTEHAGAHGRTLGASDRSLSVDDLRRRSVTTQSGADFYPWNAARGNQWLGAFQGIDVIHRGEGEALAEIRHPAPGDGHHFHPAVLDAGGQALVGARPDVAPGAEHVFVLGGIDEVRIYASPGGKVFSHATLIPCERTDSFAGDITIMDESGTVIAEMRGLRLQYLAGTAPDSPHPALTDRDDWLHEVVWPARALTGRPRRGRWLVLTDSGPTGRAVAAGLEETGNEVVVATAAARLDVTATERLRLDPADPGHFATVLAEVTAGGPLDGVVHLWALDATEAADASAGEIRRAEVHAVTSAVLLAQALDNLPAEITPELWLITKRAQHPVGAPLQAPLWGIGRTLAAEQPRTVTRLVDLDGTTASLRALVDEIGAPDDENQIALRDGRRHVARLVHRQDRQADGRPSRVTIETPGVLGDLTVAPATVRQPGDGEVVIRVSHAGLNYRDVLSALGMYPGQDLDAPAKMGWECAGVIAQVGPGVHDVHVGDEVIAIAEGALASHVVAKASLTAPKPTRLTAAEAATLPVAYLTAYYALHMLGRIGAGDRILIHSATGGTGMAALNIAQWKGAQVYATAGNEQKRTLLQHLGVRQVADSRSLEFADRFREATGGAGFDLVLNTLAGDAVRANLDLMAPYGHYLELSKRDIAENTPIGSAVFARNLSLHAIDVVHMVRERPEYAGRILREVAGLAQDGLLRPLPYEEFPAAKASDAFGLMARSGHIGKIVLDFTAPVTAQQFSATEQLEVHPHATYLITGGLGGIGGEIASWLADRGARHLLLLGRTPHAGLGPDVTARLDALRAGGVRADYAAIDVTDRAALRGLLDGRDRDGLPVVRGLFHAAGVIGYQPLSDVSGADVSRGVEAKIAGGWALHEVLSGRHLDMFVLFSSGSAVLGSPMLGVYAAGNAFLDALAAYRRAKGLPATTVNWGYWNQVGMVARKQEEEQRSLVPRGMSSFSPQDGLAALEHVLVCGIDEVVVLPADWRQWGAAYPQAAAAPLVRDLVTGARRPRPVGEADSGFVSPRPADRSAAPNVLRPAPAPAAPRSAPLMPASRSASTLAVPETSPAPAVSRPASAPQTVASVAPPVTVSRAPAVTAPPAGAAPTPGVVAPVAAADPSAQSATAPAAPVADRSALRDRLTAQAAQVLGQRPEKIATGRPLKQMGMDSLMAVEFRNRVQREFGWRLPVVDILNGITLDQIADAVAAAPFDDGALARPADPAPSPAPVAPLPAVPAPAPVALAPPPAVAARTVPAGPPSVRPTPPVAVPVVSATDGDLMPRLLAQAAQVLGQRPEKIATGRPLKQMGMDSLMAVELRNRVQREFGWRLPVVDILNGITLDQIAAAIRAGAPA